MFDVGFVLNGRTRMSFAIQPSMAVVLASELTKATLVVMLSLGDGSACILLSVIYVLFDLQSQSKFVFRTRTRTCLSPVW